MVDTYRVRVRGHLDDRWSDWLGGLAVQRQADGTTVLTGPIRDQAALFGVIAGIRDLGLALLSVQCDEEGSAPFGNARATRVEPNDDIRTGVPGRRVL
jgi:hypothetical protein